MWQRVYVHVHMGENLICWTKWTLLVYSNNMAQNRQSENRLEVTWQMLISLSDLWMHACVRASNLVSDSVTLAHEAILRIRKNKIQLEQTK